MARQSPYISSAQFTYPSSYQQRENRYTGNSNVETAMGLNRRPSLLAGYHNPFTSPERASLAYYQSLGPMSMGPHADEHSKRSRYLTGGNLNVNSQLLPLSIEVKKEQQQQQQQQQVYQPQTEAISPTPDDPKNDTTIRDSTIIRNAISKLEADIDITMKKLHRAKLSQSEIKSQADRSAADEDDNDDRDDLLRTNGSQTLIEKILHDNRKKAEDSHKMFNHLNNHLDLTIPFYQEPNDLELIENIRRQYINRMKIRLKEYFKRKQQTSIHRFQYQINKYDEFYRQWQKSIEKEEKLITNKDQTIYRDIFEKTFPELRKTREDKEKKQTILNETSSEQQLSLNTNNPSEQETEHDEDKLRKSSIVPPIIYDQYQRKHPYFNQNSLIKRDAAEFYKERTKMPFWTNEEKQIFIDKFTQSPKNFGYISSFLENKTTEQCVQFYYLTKKSENYKNLLRKQSQTNRRKAKQTTTTTTVTSSTTIETTLITKVTSSNMIVSSTSQQLLGQDSERTIDRIENDDERRDNNSIEANEEKRANKNRCQLLSCTTEKLGKKKNRKNRLRAFPNKWNDLTTENQDAIRRTLQIPSNVQRCCTRCYEKLIIQVRQRQTNQEEDDDDDETSKNRTMNTQEQTLKSNEEWTENDIRLFDEALEKYSNDWIRIGEYVHRSESHCRAFFQKYRTKTKLIDDEQNNDEDNGSISGSEEPLRRLILPTKSRDVNEDHGDEQQQQQQQQQILVNEDSIDSNHEMIIDDVDEQTSNFDEKKLKSSNLNTINSILEKQISKTLHQSERRLMNNPDRSPDKSSTINTSSQIPPPPPPPPPLVTIRKSRSPPLPSQTFSTKGSIMRGTPISPSTKPITVDTSNVHSHHYANPRSDYTHSSSHNKPAKTLDQQHLYLQQQQQQQQAAYMRHYPSNNFRPSSTNSKSSNVDASNTDTFETLRADFVTSRYLTTTQSPNHERQTRHPSEQRSPSQTSAAPMNQQLLPPPTAIAPPSANSHHSQQQQAALLAASQILASSGMYPQDLLNSGLLPYSHYYGSIPGNSFYVDPRLMHDFNSEQLKNLRSNRHLPSTHSPPDSSTYASKRHAHENLEHMRYSTSDYPTSVWRQQNPQQIHSQMKSAENPLLKLNEFARHSTRVPSALDRDVRSPDEFHHRVNPTRSTLESPSGHFQRVESHNLHKNASNPNLHYSDHSPHVHKIHANNNHHHLHTSTSSNRSSGMSSTQISPHHPSAYLYHGLHHSPAGTTSSQRSIHQNESTRTSKEPISIQEFMKQSVNEFVASTNVDNKNLTSASRTRSIDNVDQPILIDGDDDSDSVREQNDVDGNSKNRSNPDVNKSSNTDGEMSETRRDSSIKKILSNQPLEKQEYIEINQKVQNSTVGASKVHSNNEGNNLERSNSTSGREATRSRGSITMRMLMGASDIYADGKAQPMATNELANEQSNKRPASPSHDKVQSLEYLIRGELVRACPTLPKNDEQPNIFHNRRSSPSNQQQMFSKRMRTSPRDDSDKSRSPSNIRDPFALQTSSKTSQHSPNSSSTNAERSWQSYVQQQYQQAFGVKTSRSTITNSGSITQGNPISPTARLTTDQQYPLAANNQLVNPRYSQYINKNDSPFDHSPKGKFVRRVHETHSSSSDTPHELPLTINTDQTSNLKSPSPISLSTSPTASNSSHPLKKRLISEYEQEQQRTSPVTSPSTIKTETIEEITSNSPPKPPSLLSAENVEQSSDDIHSDMNNPPTKTTEESTESST